MAGALFASPTLAWTLEDAIRSSLAQHERAAAAEAETRASRATVARARAFFFPDLTLEGDYVRRSRETTRIVDGEVTTVGSRDGLEGRVRAEQTLLDARAFPLLQQARQLRDAAVYDERETKRQLAFETARAFLAALNTEEVSRAARERRALAQRNLEEVRVRFDAALVSSNDVTRAELELSSAERELAGASGRARTAKLMLGFLTGTEIADTLTVPSSLLRDAKAPIAAGAPLVDPDLRPDVRAERARAGAARSFAREPLGRYFPEVTLTGLAWSTNDTGVNTEARDWSLGVGFDWPIFDGGDREATRSQRSALAKAAELRLRELERSVRVDTEIARVSVESEQTSLDYAEAAARAAARNAAETAELYRRGIVRAFETVDANVQLFLAEVERAGAELALGLAYLNYRAAIGLEPLVVEGEP